MSSQKNLVVLSGAGISAESGLQTFRDSDGLWNNYKIEEVATPGAFARDPQLVLDFYNMRRNEILKAQPNAAHLGLAELEKDFQVNIITQNIDDLHERAGSTNVLHLHGEILKMRSVKNDQLFFDCNGNIEVGNLAPDGGQLRPHIVWFEEQVPMIEYALSILEQADILVIIGTSLQVYPAASLLHYVPAGIPIFVIDKKIPVVNAASNFHLIEEPAGVGIGKLKEMLKVYR